MATGGRRHRDRRLRLTFAGGRRCQPAASRRTSSWCTTSSSFDIRAVSGVKVPGRLRRAFPLVRRRSARLRGRGRRRAELVCRVQRARPGCRRARSAASPISSPASPPAGSSAACRRRCAAAATDLHALSGVRRLHRRAKIFQRTAGVETFIDASRLGATEIEPDVSTTTGRAQLIGARAAGSRRCSCFVYLTANHFPWTYPLARRADARLARPRQCAGGRRISPPADDERARLRRSSAPASKRDFPGRVVPAGAVRRSPAEFRRHVLEPGARRGRDRAGACMATIRAISPPTTRSMPSTSAR